MITGIPIYNGVDLLDVAAPYEIFNWMKEKAPDLRVEVYLLAEELNDVKTLNGLTMKPHKKFRDFSTLDVLWVPGADPAALKALMNDPRRTYLNFLRTVSYKARFVTSVCEGALLLAKAGLLDGYEAPTHWAFIPCLKKYPKVKIVEGCPRFVVDRNRVTGGGISSGLDEAFKLVELLSSYQVAQEVQRVTQYYPCPPVASTLPKADTCPLDYIRQRNSVTPQPRLDMTGMLLPERAADEKYPILCSRSVCCLAWVVRRGSSTQALPATATPWHRRGDGRGVPV